MAASDQVTELCSASGSIQKLVTNTWKTVGVGQLTLLHNLHNPSKVLLRVVRSKNNQTIMFQCKPKAKEQGKKALILKGVDTKTKQEFVLAVRSKSGLNDFRTTIDRVARKPGHKRKPSQPPAQLRAKLINYAWDCQLCTFRNAPQSFNCEVCNHPRPLDKRISVDDDDSIGVPSMQADVTSALVNSLPAVLTPKAAPSTAPSTPPSGTFPDTNLDEPEEKSPRSPLHLTDAAQLGVIEEQNSKHFEDDEDDADEKVSTPVSVPSVKVMRTLSLQEVEELETISDLIAKVTSNEEVHGIKPIEVEDILLLCHETFTSSPMMLATLLSRVCSPELEDVQTRIRAVKMAQNWMKRFWAADFADNDEMHEAMEAFCAALTAISTSQAPSAECEYSEQLNALSDGDLKLVARVKGTFEQKVAEAQIEERKQTVRGGRGNKMAAIFGGVDVPKGYVASAQKALEIAQQLTLMDFALFGAIEKREMTNQAWKRKDKEKRAPNILNMIAQFNHISKWTQMAVLAQRSKRKRARCIEKMIQVANHLLELRSFSACCAVFFGLNTTAIHRLEAAWLMVGKKEREVFDGGKDGGIKAVFTNQGNWPLLRVLHNDAHAPAVLHTGLFLQDLFNTDEGNENKNKNGTVNFMKLRATYVLIEKCCMYQNGGYEMKEDVVMQTALRRDWQRQQGYSEDQIWKVSTLCKKSDADNKEIAEGEIEKLLR